MLQIGNKGEEIKQLQIKLNKLGWFKGKINGEFDSVFQNAICRFQQHYHLKTDGIIGNNTLSILNQLYKALPKPKPVVNHKKLIEMNEKIFTHVHPEVIKLGKQLRQIIKDKYNIDIIFTFGYRSINQQNNLYAQGRTRKGEIVTNAKGGYSYHNYGLALDFVPIVNGKADWKDIEKFKLVGQEAIKLKFEYGGNFKNIKDYGHIQLTFGLSINELLSGKVPK